MTAFAWGVGAGIVIGIVASAFFLGLLHWSARRDWHAGVGRGAGDPPGPE